MDCFVSCADREIRGVDMEAFNDSFEELWFVDCSFVGKEQIDIVHIHGLHFVVIQFDGQFVSKLTLGS
jgi:hypothetical protein